MRRAKRYLVVGCLGILLSGCGGDSPTQPGGGSVTIVLASSTVTFGGVAGKPNPPTQAIAVTATRTTPAPDLSVGTVSYGAGGSGWLTATLDRATAPATLSVTAATGGLAAGVYTATFPVLAPAAANSPQTVSVSFLVLRAGGATTIDQAGTASVFLGSPDFATELTLQGGAQYLIAVVNTGTDFATTEDFTLAGAIEGGATATAAAAAGRAPVVTSARAGGPGRGPLFSAARLPVTDLATFRRLATTHIRTLEANRQLYARRGSPRLARERVRAARAAGVPAPVAVSQNVGDVNKVYVANMVTNSCTSVDSIGARTVAVGQHVIVLADTNLTTWPQQNRPDSSFYQQFANEYDQVTWPHLQTYIGDPLAYDASLSGVGKVTVTLTPVLNNLNGGVVAFVNVCDFFPFASSGPDADFSNETEMIFSWVPASTGFSVPAWEKQLRATASHESEHVVSTASRVLQSSATLEETWLEEGLAQVSSEIWMRNFSTASWKSYANFNDTVACEINLGPAAPCDQTNDKPLDLVLSHLPFFFLYLQDESQSTEGLGKDVQSDYGAGWALARWTTDQYASDEAAFVHSLVTEPALTGVVNLSSHTSQAVPLLLVYWNLATGITTGSPGNTAADPRLFTPSFNFVDIFTVGQTDLTCGGVHCGLFTDSGIPVLPVTPVALNQGTFTQRITGLPGTGASFFLLTAGAPGTEALQLLSASQGPISLSSGVRVGILRLQ